MKGLLMAPVLVVALASCGGSPAAEVTPTPTRTPTITERVWDGVHRCAKWLKNDSNLSQETLHSGDAGRTITVKSVDNDGHGMGFSQSEVACILQGLEVPDSVLTHIKTTRALDGQQTDSWSGINARWTFSAGSGEGLHITLTQKETA